MVILSYIWVVIVPNAILEKVLSRSLRGPRQKAAHHYRWGPEADGLHDVPDRLNPAVGDDRHAESSGVFRHLVHGCRLTSPDRHNLLRDTNGSAAHANAKSVNSGVDEVFGLRGRDDVAADNLHAGIVGLDIVDHLDLEDGVALARVQDDDIDAGTMESL